MTHFKGLFPILFFMAMTPAFAQHSHSGGSSQPSPSRSRDYSGQEDNEPKVHATNTICPVMGRPVKPGRDREVVIRGNYYLVCCDGCGPDMSEHYDKYLDKEGRPLNDPKRQPKPDPKKDADKPVPAPPAPKAN